MTQTKNLKKFCVSRYDPKTTEAPFKTIQIDTLEIEKPEGGYLGSSGELFWERISAACHLKGYSARFYTTSQDSAYDYEVVVCQQFMRTKEITKIIDNNTLRFTCKDEGAGFLDTEVTINGTFFCWISYPELDSFVAEFEELMSKYRI